jgi:hypothetical protein
LEKTVPLDAPTIELLCGAVVAATALYGPVRDALVHSGRKHKKEELIRAKRDDLTDRMHRDWFGEPGVEGVSPPRPGVLFRLSSMEQHLTTIDHEVNFNSGKSIKDAVHRTDKAVADVADSLDKHLERSRDFQERVADKLGAGPTDAIRRPV